MNVCEKINVFCDLAAGDNEAYRSLFCLHTGFHLKKSMTIFNEYNNSDRAVEADCDIFAAISFQRNAF